MEKKPMQISTPEREGIPSAAIGNIQSIYKCC